MIWVTCQRMEYIKKTIWKTPLFDGVFLLP